MGGHRRLDSRLVDAIGPSFELGKSSLGLAGAKQFERALQEVTTLREAIFLD